MSKITEETLREWVAKGPGTGQMWYVLWERPGKYQCVTHGEDGYETWEITITRGTWEENQDHE